jgi:hypothetical protein
VIELAEAGPTCGTPCCMSASDAADLSHGHVDDVYAPTALR